MSGWLRAVVAGAVLVAGGCISIPQETAEMAPVRLRSTQTGARERCGMEFIREVQRANDLGWSEQLIYTWSARSEAQAALQDEAEWRQRCVERFRKQGYEVVTDPPAR